MPNTVIQQYQVVWHSPYWQAVSPVSSVGVDVAGAWCIDVEQSTCVPAQNASCLPDISAPRAACETSTRSTESLTCCDYPQYCYLAHDVSV